MFFKFKINNELLGILYMLLCQFSFATNDAFVKVIYENYDEIFVLNQIIFIRGIFTLLFILLFLYIKKEVNFKYTPFILPYLFNNNNSSGLARS